MKFALLTLVVTGVVSWVSAVAADEPCEQVLLRSEVWDGGGVGRVVAIQDDWGVVGASLEDENAVDTGAVYVFWRDGEEWKLRGRLTGEGLIGGERFGSSVAIWGDRIVVGAPGEIVGDSTGVVYVYEFDGTHWNQQARLVSSNADGGVAFGTAVGCMEDTVLIGASDGNQAGPDAGVVFVFEKEGNDWIEMDKLLAADGEAGDYFGAALSTSKRNVAIGAPGNDDFGPNSGSVYVFERDGEGWIEEAKLLPSDGVVFQGFGAAVANNSGDWILIGAAGDDRNGSSAGAAYIFEGDRNGWREFGKLLASDGEAGDEFGCSVAAFEEGLVIGASGDDDAGVDSGSVYLFHYGGGGWPEMFKFSSSDAGAEQQFGSAVSLDGGTALIGADYTRDDGFDFNAVYAIEVYCLNRQCLGINVLNLVAGEVARFFIGGGTPGARGVMVYGVQEGQTTVRNYFGFCATFGIAGVSQERIIGGLKQRFDMSGSLRFERFISENLKGQRLFFQSAERGTCPEECVSGVLEMVVE